MTNRERRESTHNGTCCNSQNCGISVDYIRADSSRSYRSNSLYLCVHPAESQKGTYLVRSSNG